MPSTKKRRLTTVGVGFDEEICLEMSVRLQRVLNPGAGYWCCNYLAGVRFFKHIIGVVALFFNVRAGETALSARLDGRYIHLVCFVLLFTKGAWT